MFTFYIYFSMIQKRCCSENYQPMVLKTTLTTLEACLKKISTLTDRLPTVTEARGR